MRILITAAPGNANDWTVVLESLASKARWQRRMVRVGDGDDAFPGRDPETTDPALPGFERPLSEWSTADAATIAAAYKTIVNRQPKIGDVSKYGKYLFDVLIGETIWKAITDEASAKHDDIELALKWDWAGGPLSRLHWEMMSTADRFLASGYADGPGVRDVAITRIVPDTTVQARVARPVPRVLFVVGTSLLDRTMRPGAEIVGIIQRPGSESRVQWRYIEDAKPSTVKSTVKSFEPDVVHFICHGGVEAKGGAGFLQLKSDQDRGDGQFFANQIAPWLREGKTPPGMVVLSACDSGAALAPQQVAPLAAALVKEDVPVVIGMSGRISDIACRLFTRRFAEALICSDDDETLVNATALGRRAAFSEGNNPELSVDWGFPTVYLSSAVETNYVPTSKQPDGTLTVEQRLPSYALRRHPVFCGRHNFFDAFRDLMSKQVGALAAFVASEKRGYGRTRLLEAITIQSLIDGHVPCPVLVRDTATDRSAPQGTGWKAPVNPMELGRLIDDAMEMARKSLRLEYRQARPIEDLQDFQRGTIKLEDLSPTSLQRAVRRDLGPGSQIEISGAAVKLALELQFAELMRAARKAAPGVIGADSRAVVLLDEVDQYINVLREVVKTDLGSYGFGTATEAVPIVFAFSLPSAQQEQLKPIAEKKEPGNVTALELGPFRREANYREDMLMYARYFMHTPLQLDRGQAEMPWVMDFEATSLLEKFEKLYQDNFAAIPAEFDHPEFTMLARVAQVDQFLKPANETAWLEQTRKGK
jgi:hypothetical protein